ncbi:hypothetical protein CHS0354_042926 [Potamilus streckersoni]|uniref:Uncharacterized protein n=1 Tax=Potamilus streckersoni TaxID=2493646 RepID=A0AAE0W7G6_9BIVA|nr:hypothetical protein CHS0354_042926 [Potamilus streckersoni]
MEKDNHQKENKSIDGDSNTTQEETPRDPKLGTYLKSPTSKDIIQRELDVQPHPARITRASLKKASAKIVKLEDDMKAKSRSGCKKELIKPWLQQRQCILNKHQHYTGYRQHISNNNSQRDG